jgi:hypothetical protein
MHISQPFNGVRRFTKCYRLSVWEFHVISCKKIWWLREGGFLDAWGSNSSWRRPGLHIRQHSQFPGAEVEGMGQQEHRNARQFRLNFRVASVSNPMQFSNRCIISFDTQITSIIKNSPAFWGIMTCSPLKVR